MLRCDKDPSVCDYMGTCDRKSKICCSGFPRKCLLHPKLNALRPLKSCEFDKECGIDGLCDKLMGVCCVLIHTPELLCPNKLSFWALEPRCEDEVYCRKDAFCHNGHCCPRHKTRVGQNQLNHVVEISEYPYPLSTECDPKQIPSQENTFCSLGVNKLTILGRKNRRTGKKVRNLGKLCRFNSDCGQHQVCVLKRDTRMCYENPLIDQSYDNEFYPLISIFISAFPVLIFLLIILCRSSYKSKQKQIDYQRVYDKKKRITLSDGYYRFYV